MTAAAAVRVLPPAPGTEDVVYIQPGQLAGGGAPRVLTTILGSCVAVCVWDPKARAGAMNHFLLPASPGGQTRSLRFADGAMPALVDRALAEGAHRLRLEAQIFGGACVLEAMRRSADHLGTRNLEAALLALADLHIPVRGGDAGGLRGRRIQFDLATGLVAVRTL